MPDLTNDFAADARLCEQLASLAARIGVDLAPEEFRVAARRQLEIYAAHADGRDRTHVTAFLQVLVHRGCHPVLVIEVARVLTEEIPHRTVKAAANHAGVNRRTLERHWRALLSDRDLHDCLRLALLVRVTRAQGGWQERARAAGISFETARSLARDLTGQPLLALIRRPTSIIEVLESWLA